MREDQFGSLPPPPGSSKSKQSSRASARHVAFSETSTPSTKPDGAFLPPPDLDGERPKRFRPRAYACCAWGCMFIFAFVLLALILGFVFISIFHSYLPEIKVRRFNATRIDFGNAQNKQKVSLKGKVDLLVEFNNKNEKTELKFGLFKVSASAAHVDLGKTEFQPFTQPKKSTKSLNATIGVNHPGVDKEDADLLKQDIQNHEVDLTLTLVGSVSFPISGIMMNKIPIMASCDCKQTEVDFGKNAKCDYRIFQS
ncbi:uncharacterized protein LOC133731736 [Rosa rugosa]|uniref:uncharacterized protein LOC133731736 n=1 Tax=Rosa rugosa TaxID=74645 RepID=UPI002B402848|nr:uncharacterized protein LOC133731736 [Rosa rugosa]